MWSLASYWTLELDSDGYYSYIFDMIQDSDPATNNKEPTQDISLVSHSAVQPVVSTT